MPAVVEPAGPSAAPTDSATGSGPSAGRMEVALSDDSYVIVHRDVDSSALARVLAVPFEELRRTLGQDPANTLREQGQRHPNLRRSYKAPTLRVVPSPITASDRHRQAQRRRSAGLACRGSRPDLRDDPEPLDLAPTTTTGNPARRPDDKLLIRIRHLRSCSLTHRWTPHRFPLPIVQPRHITLSGEDGPRRRLALLQRGVEHQA